jgi:uncharacterized protein YgbK (DUF1537 family)
MDPSALAQFLAPFLPYLVVAGRDVAEKAAHALGSEAWEHAQALWERLRGSVDAKPAAREAAEDVARAPDDARAVAALELQLEKLLAADRGLADELARLWEQGGGARATIASGDRAVAIGGDVEGSVIQTGDRSSVDR